MATAATRKPANGQARKVADRNWSGISDEAVKKATGCGWDRRFGCLTWVDGETNVEANFYAKGTSKSSVAIQHNKPGGPKDVAKMRAYSGKALASLKELLEP